MSRARALADIVAGTIDKTAGSPVDSQSVTAGTSDVRARPKVSTSLTIAGTYNALQSIDTDSGIINITGSGVLNVISLD